MNRTILYTLGIVLCLFMSCCERRPLEELFTEEAVIPVEFDWSKSTLDPSSDQENLYNSSIHIYGIDDSKPFNGSNHREFVFNSPMGGTISLPVGSYRCIAINNSVEDYDNGSFFSGITDYDKFIYGARQSGDNRAMTELLEPNILCALHTSTLTVTPGMVKSSNPLGYPMSDEEKAQNEKDLKQLVGITPERLTRHVHVTVHVKNLRSSSSASGKITGLSHTVYPVNKERESGDFCHCFGFSKTVMDSDNPKNGTMEGDFEIIGIDNSSKHKIEIRFKLTESVDGSMYYPSETKPPYCFDIEKYLLDSSSVNIDIDLSIAGLPDLKVGGGFVPDIGDWGEDEWVEIPI